MSVNRFFTDKQIEEWVGRIANYPAIYGDEYGQVNSAIRQAIASMARFVDERDATIQQQAAEIERLRHLYNETARRVAQLEEVAAGVAATEQPAAWEPVRQLLQSGTQLSQPALDGQRAPTIIYSSHWSMYYVYDGYGTENEYDSFDAAMAEWLRLVQRPATSSGEQGAG